MRAAQDIADAPLRFETLVRTCAPRGSGSAGRPCGPALHRDVQRSSSARDDRRDTFLKQKNANPGDARRRGAATAFAIIGGITHGTPLAILAASVSGRLTQQRADGRLVNKPVGDAAMNTIGRSWIRASIARRWGDRNDRGGVRDGVPTSRVPVCRCHGIRAPRVPERWPLRAAIERPCRTPSFSSPRSNMRVVPGVAASMRFSPCAAVPIAPGKR